MIPAEIFGIKISVPMIPKRFSKKEEKVIIGDRPR